MPSVHRFETGPYKVNADDELCLAALAALDFCQPGLVRRVLAYLRLTVSVRLRLHGIARRCGLLV